MRGPTPVRPGGLPAARTNRTPLPARAPTLAPPPTRPEAVGETEGVELAPGGSMIVGDEDDPGAEAVASAQAPPRRPPPRRKSPSVWSWIALSLVAVAALAAGYSSQRSPEELKQELDDAASFVRVKLFGVPLPVPVPEVPPTVAPSVVGGSAVEAIPVAAEEGDGGVSAEEEGGAPPAGLGAESGAPGQESDTEAGGPDAGELGASPLQLGAERALAEIPQEAYHPPLSPAPATAAEAQAHNAQLP